MSADANRATVERLYRCFAERDGAGMAACYAPDATFSDPVFPDLRGREVGGMWRMLTERAQDFSVELTGLDGEPEGEIDRYVARWTAHYVFSATGRKVVNHVTSTLSVRDGLIVTQKDVFDLPAWLAQALGPFGRWLGWTGLPARMIRAGARRGLADYLKKHPA